MMVLGYTARSPFVLRVRHNWSSLYALNSGADKFPIKRKTKTTPDFEALRFFAVRFSVGTGTVCTSINQSGSWSTYEASFVLKRP